MMKRYSRFLVLSALIGLCTITIRAQRQGDKPEGRKLVAVVLSGGGAKGMAHIGALKVIERAGIPIDIVTGTSMGSIIGGLYAIGYDANRMDSIVRVQDWDYVMSDRENLAQQSLADRKKQNTYVINVGLTFGKRNYNDGGIIKGKNIGELFQQLCTGYTDSLDFTRDLPIPFACVATNIIDNTEYDFHSGHLPQAMRASMAIPAAFSPVRIGDMVLSDGGLKNNYPADIARVMGADIIIGVTVQGVPKVADDMVTTMSILSQIIDVNCKNKYDENLAITDVAIRANTTGYNAASFSPSAIDTLIRRGEEAAMAHWDELIALKKRIGIDDSFRPAALNPLGPKTMSRRMHVTECVFENMTRADEKYLKEKFHLNRLDSIDSELMQRITTSVRMDLFYQTAECRLDFSQRQQARERKSSTRLIPRELRSKADDLEAGDKDVRVVITAGNRKTAQLYAGLRFDTEEYAAIQGGTDFQLKGALPTAIDLAVRLGKRMMSHADITFHHTSFTMPKVSFTSRRNDYDVYVKGRRGYNIRDNELQAEVTPINFNARNVNLQMGLRWDYQHYRNLLEASSGNLEIDNGQHYFSYRARLAYNSENNWCFPTRGSRFKAEYAYLTDDFAQLQGTAGMSEVNAHWRTSLTIGDRFTLQPMVYGRLLFGSVVPLFWNNAVGTEWFGHYVEQQMPFAGIGNIEYVGRQFVAAQLQAQQRIADKHYVLLRVAGGQQAHRLSTLFDAKTMMGVQASYYLSTIFGPVGASLGYSNRTRKGYFYLNLGYEF